MSDHREAGGGGTGEPPGWLRRAWITLKQNLKRAFGFLRRNREPISEGIETAGRGWTRTARTAARIGRSLAAIGAVITKNAGSGSKRGQKRRRLAAFGTGVTRFGEWLTRTGRRWGPIGENIEDIGEHLGEQEPAPLPPEEKALPAKPEPEPPVPAEPPKEPPAILSPDIREAIESLGKRPRTERLRSVILAICRTREWTTAAELADLLGISEGTLRYRHLGPMVEAGELMPRDPEEREEQAFGIPDRS